MDMLLAEWKTWDEQIAKVDVKITERASQAEQQRNVLRDAGRAR
jgi:hypothetical protein